MRNDEICSVWVGYSPIASTSTAATAASYHAYTVQSIVAAEADAIRLQFRLTMRD